MPERIQLVNSPLSPLRSDKVARFQEIPPKQIFSEEYVREHFTTAGVLPILDSERVLLGAHKTVHGALWGPFAGKREAGETPETTATRELAEELGIVLQKLYPPLIIIKFNPYEKSAFSIGLVFVTKLTGREQFNVPNREIDSVRDFSPGELFGLMDWSDSSMFLWGDKWTQAVLNEWIWSCEEGRRKGTKSHKVFNHLYFQPNVYRNSPSLYSSLKKSSS